MRHFEDLTGRKYGRRTVLCRADDRFSTDGYPMRYWKCVCECGTVNDVAETHLIHGKANSCGCLSRDIARNRQTKHGGVRTRLYHIWCGIKARTCNPNSPAWKDYGGRGITMCEEWKNSFEAFRAWALSSGYELALTIDRIDNDGGYSPTNCRWATIAEQARNKRNTIKVCYDGETLNMHEWSLRTGIPEKVLKERYHSGWTAEELLFSPVSPRTRRRIHATM